MQNFLWRKVKERPSVREVKAYFVDFLKLSSPQLKSGEHTKLRERVLSQDLKSKIRVVLGLKIGVFSLDQILKYK